jgi:hypothetical protein
MRLGGIGWRRGYGVSRRRRRTTGLPRRPRSAATAANTCFRHWRSAAVAWSGGRSAPRPPATSSHLAADRPNRLGLGSRSRWIRASGRPRPMPPRGLPEPRSHRRPKRDSRIPRSLAQRSRRRITTRGTPSLWAPSQSGEGPGPWEPERPPLPSRRLRVLPASNRHHHRHRRTRRRGPRWPPEQPARLRSKGFCARVAFETPFHSRIEA